MVGLKLQLFKSLDIKSDFSFQQTRPADWRSIEQSCLSRIPSVQSNPSGHALVLVRIHSVVHSDHSLHSYIADSIWFLTGLTRQLFWLHFLFKIVHKTLLRAKILVNIPGEPFWIDFEFREAIPDRTSEPALFGQINGPPWIDWARTKTSSLYGSPTQTSSFPISPSTYTLKLFIIRYE